MPAHKIGRFWKFKFDEIDAWVKAGCETTITRSLQESFAEHIAPLLLNKHSLQSYNAFVLNMSRVEGFSKECAK